MKEMIFQKELTFIKQMHKENVCFVIIDALNMLNLNLSQIYVMNVVLDISLKKQKELKY